jgi:hypothetical protein
LASLLLLETDCKQKDTQATKGKPSPGRAGPGSCCCCCKEMFAAISAVAHVAFFITATDIRYDGD